MKQSIILAGKRLDEKGLIAGTEGNLSVRLSQTELLITASGFCKSMLTEDRITKVDMDGNVLSGLKPARDIGMHLAVYKARRDVQAIVHAHPPVTNGLGLTGFDFRKIYMPETVLSLNSIAMVDYAIPTSSALADAVKNALTDDCKAAVLKRHGAICFSGDVMEACFLMEALEMLAKTLFVASCCGADFEMNEWQIRDLKNFIAQI